MVKKSARRTRRTHTPYAHGSIQSSSRASGATRRLQHIAERVGRLLERRGLVERDMENAWLTTDGPGGPRDDLIGHW